MLVYWRVADHLLGVQPPNPFCDPWLGPFKRIGKMLCLSMVRLSSSFCTAQSYCWWTKSCTTKDDDYPTIYRVLTIPGSAGFCPSTVLPSKQMIHGHKTLTWHSMKSWLVHDRILISWLLKWSLFHLNHPVYYSQWTNMAVENPHFQ